MCYLYSIKSFTSTAWHPWLHFCTFVNRTILKLKVFTSVLESTVVKIVMQILYKNDY